MIYLDNAATTQISPKVLEAMMPYLKEEYGNAGTLYSFGRKAAEAVSLARTQVAGLIGASPEQIIFTSGGSEANSLVFFGLRDHLERLGKKHIIVSAVEHDSVIKAAESLCKPLRCNDKKCIKDQFDISFLSVNADCVVSVDELRNVLSDDVGLVSVMYVNNETGAVNPIKEIAKLCSEKGILFHTDCVQAAGCHEINVDEIGCDFLSISSHKIHGCKGVGTLYAKNKDLLSPIIYGGEVQEFGLRGGTENVAGIVGFGKACEIASDIVEYAETVSYYKRRFYTVLQNELRRLGLPGTTYVNGSKVYEKGKTLNLRFSNVDGETLLLMLDAKGICVSAGSACRSHESKPSRVLLAMGLSPDDARDSIRVSFSEFNSGSDIESAAKIIAECVSVLRAE